MIINGHHRWAAALMSGLQKIPSRIVNLMHEADVRLILERSTHTKRVTLDLDEVLFVSPEDHKTEPLLPFPLRHIYRERLRLGAPELIRRLQELGYEVWIYTSSERSERYIRSYFRHYGVRLDGIVNAQRHLREVQRDRKTPLPQKVPSFYRISLHVDDESVVVSWGKQFGYTVYQLDAQDDDWVEKILACAEKVRKKEEMMKK